MIYIYIYIALIVYYTQYHIYKYIGDNVNAYVDKPLLDQPTVRHINCSIIVEGTVGDVLHA